MRLGKFVVFTSIAIAVALPAVAATHTHRAKSSHKAAKHTAKPKFQSQRSIDDQRATEIQAALIKAGYLSGSPSGHWDSSSEAAMQKVQSDNGWQTKLVPDSRALIKLGLGPANSNDPAAASDGSVATNSIGQGQQ